MIVAAEWNIALYDKRRSLIDYTDMRLKSTLLTVARFERIKGKGKRESQREIQDYEDKLSTLNKKMHGVD